MGTNYSITLKASPEIQKSVDSMLEVINNAVSTYIPNSTISQFNQADSGFKVNLAQSPQSRRSFLQAKQADGLSLGEVYYFDPINDWILPIRVPIRNDSGTLIALNTSAVAYENFIEQYKSFNINPLYRVMLINNLFNQLRYNINRR